MCGIVVTTRYREITTREAKRDRRGRSSGRRNVQNIGSDTRPVFCDARSAGKRGTAAAADYHLDKRRIWTSDCSDFGSPVFRLALSQRRRGKRGRVLPVGWNGSEPWSGNHPRQEEAIPSKKAGHARRWKREGRNSVRRGCADRLKKRRSNPTERETVD